MFLTTIPLVSSFKIQVCTMFRIGAKKDFSFSSNSWYMSSSTHGFMNSQIPNDT